MTAQSDVVNLPVESKSTLDRGDDIEKKEVSQDATDHESIRVGEVDGEGHNRQYSDPIRTYHSY
jgi:hypothetical protein